MSRKFQKPAGILGVPPKVCEGVSSPESDALKHATSQRPSLPKNKTLAVICRERKAGETRSHDQALSLFKAPKQFFGLSIRTGSLGTPLCRKVEGVFFPFFFFFFLSCLPSIFFFQRKKNCSRIYWDRLLSSSRGKKLNIIINLKCYFFYQPEVKFSQEAEGHLRHLSNPTLPAKFRSGTHYFLLTAIQ